MEVVHVNNPIQFGTRGGQSVWERHHLENAIIVLARNTPAFFVVPDPKASTCIAHEAIVSKVRNGVHRVAVTISVQRSLALEIKH
jgi:hypothetical protein